MLTEKSTASKSNQENQKAPARSGITWLRWVFLILLFQASQYLFATLNIAEFKAWQAEPDGLVDARSLPTEKNTGLYEPMIRDNGFDDPDGIMLSFQQVLESKTILQYFPE